MIFDYLLIIFFVFPMLGFVCYSAVMTLRLEVAKNDNCN